jgi:hypothetical protein
MDVSGGRDANGQNIHMWKKHGGLNQQWDLIYVDEMPEPLKPCDLNDEWGLKVDCDMHILTQMSSKRYLDRVGNDVVIKTPNSFKTQVWYFDDKMKTIRNRKDNYALNIQSNGRSNNVAVTTSNSKWW